MEIQVVIGDITNQPDVDAIVNSTNANLRMGSGVAGAIHNAAGPKLEEYCKPFVPLELGSALITPGFQLSNPWIIHVRAAHYINNTEPERYLAFAICSMINTAKQNNIRSLAMPAIGTGVYKFPLLLAARIISKTLSQYSLMQTDIDLVRICVINEEVMNKFKYALELERDPALSTSSND
jgi:O-acetyl-ADP-ribose deacetylase (regulator of RNase III)